MELMTKLFYAEDWEFISQDYYVAPHTGIKFFAARLRSKHNDETQVIMEDAETHVELIGKVLDSYNLVIVPNADETHGYTAFLRVRES